MKTHENLIDALDSELVIALSADTRRRQHAAPAIKAAALQSAADQARAALNKRDAEMEASYHQRAGRLTQLGKLAKDAKDRLAIAVAALGVPPLDLTGPDAKPLRGERKEAAKRAWSLLVEQARKDAPVGAGDALDRARADLANVNAERSVLFGQAIDLRYDLDPEGGRFIRSARYHQYGVGMLALDPADIVSEAIELCYRDERALTVITIGWDDGGAPRELTVPTIGAMYRNIWKAHRLALNRFRQSKKGLTTLYSLDALKEAGVEPGEHFDHYGFEYGDVPVTRDGRGMRVQDASASRRALREAAWREAQEDTHDEATMRERMTWADKSASVPNVLRVAVKMLAAGATLDATARKLGIRPTSLEATIRSHEWAATA